MPDVIQLPKISASVLGGSYPVKYATVHAEINYLLNFSVTISTSDAKDGGILTVNMIRKLAAKAQDAIYKTPQQSNVTLQISGYKGGSLSVEGILSGVECTATTDGGLECTITATGNDSLLSMVSYNVYLDYANGQTAAEEIFGSNKQGGPIYVAALSPGQRESSSDSIAKRLYNLINVAKSKWQKYSKLDDQPGPIKNAIQGIAKINDKAFNFVGKFLGRSDKTSKIFDGKCNINKATSNQIMNGLHSLLFCRGLNFLEAVMAACGEFGLCYIPKLKEKGKGYLENSKLGNDESGGSVSVYTKSFNYSCGNRWAGKPPCIGVIVRAQSYANAASTVFSVNKSPASRMLVGCFPKSPKRQFGATYVLDAPGWLSLPIISGEDSMVVTKGMGEQLKGGKLQRTTRDKKAPKINYNLAVSKQKPNVESATDILSALAEREYYRILLSPSTARIIGAYSGAPTAEVGDVVDVQMSPGGQVVKGVLQSIDINVSPQESMISYGIIEASITGSRIK